jgi:hypothetical protein
MLPCQAHQREMALMKIAHGWNKDRSVLSTQLITQILNVADDLHGGFL